MNKGRGRQKCGEEQRCSKCANIHNVFAVFVNMGDLFLSKSKCAKTIINTHTHTKTRGGKSATGLPRPPPLPPNPPHPENSYYQNVQRVEALPVIRRPPLRSSVWEQARSSIKGGSKGGTRLPS